jgi:hypothetical protein
MIYLPTFALFLGQMLVNIPYMEHMGYQRLRYLIYVSLPHGLPERALGRFSEMG